jgi:hypothetical protein
MTFYIFYMMHYIFYMMHDVFYMMHEPFLPAQEPRLRLHYPRGLPHDAARRADDVFWRLQQPWATDADVHDTDEKPHPQ